MFDALMSRLKGYYTLRKNAKIEGRGLRYEFGDFVLKVGSVSLAGSFKGIVVEVSSVQLLMNNFRLPETH